MECPACTRLKLLYLIAEVPPSNSETSPPLLALSQAVLDQLSDVTEAMSATLEAVGVAEMDTEKRLNERDEARRELEKVRAHISLLRSSK